MGYYSTATEQIHEHKKVTIIDRINEKEFALPNE